MIYYWLEHYDTMSSEKMQYTDSGIQIILKACYYIDAVSSISSFRIIQEIFIYNQKNYDMPKERKREARLH